MKPPEKGPGRGVGDGSELLTIGITFAITVAGCVVLGILGDRRFGTAPLLTLIGTAAGVGLGGYWLYFRLSRFQ